jgi:hypothetical protein
MNGDDNDGDGGGVCGSRVGRVREQTRLAGSCDAGTRASASTDRKPAMCQRRPHMAQTHRLECSECSVPSHDRGAAKLGVDSLSLRNRDRVTVNLKTVKLTPPHLVLAPSTAAPRVWPVTCGVCTQSRCRDKQSTAAGHGCAPIRSKKGPKKALARGTSACPGPAAAFSPSCTSLLPFYAGSRVARSVSADPCEQQRPSAAGYSDGIGVCGRAVIDTVWEVEKQAGAEVKADRRTLHFRTVMSLLRFHTG